MSLHCLCHKTNQNKEYSQSSEPIKTQRHMATDTKRGKTCASKSRLVLVLLVIGQTKWHYCLNQSLSVLMHNQRECESLSRLERNLPNREMCIVLHTVSGAQILGSIVVSIPACHARDRGSIPRRGEMFCFLILFCLSSINFVYPLSFQ